MSGKIRYGKIVVHEGGEVSGDIKSLNAAEAVVAPKTSGVANSGDSNIAAVNQLLAKSA